MRSLAFSLCLVLASCAHAQTPDQVAPDPMLAAADLSTPEAAVYSMMRAMYQGDAEMIDQVFADGAQLRRVSADGTLRPDGLARWRDWVSALEPGQAHEDLFAVSSQQLGPLATVWAPFVIRVDGALVGCGVNTLTLARIEADWRIVFGMDTGEPVDTCSTFKARYLSGDRN